MQKLPHEFQKELRFWTLENKEISREFLKCLSQITTTHTAKQKRILTFVVQILEKSVGHSVEHPREKPNLLNFRNMSTMTFHGAPMKHISFMTQPRHFGLTFCRLQYFERLIRCQAHSLLQLIFMVTELKQRAH